MSRKVVVTFHRTYEVSEKEVNQLVEERFGYNTIIEDDLYMELGEEIARRNFEEESSYFEENSKDFVSATKEIVP